MGEVIVTASTLRGEQTQVVRIEGELAFDTAVDTQARLDRLIGTDTRRVVIDVAGLTMLDSSGLTVLVSIWTRLRRDGSRLELQGLAGQPLRLLTVTGCASLFTAPASDHTPPRSGG